MGCPRTQALGGCRKVSPNPGITTTNWFYTGGPYSTEAQVMQACADEFVSP